MGFPWFVFVLGAFPTLFAFVHNYGQTPAREVVAPLAIGLAAAALLTGLAFLVRRDGRAAGVAAAILLGWFVSFGLQWMVVQQLPVFPSKYGALLLTGIPALVLAGVVLWRPALAEPLVRPLNTFAFILLGLSLLNLGMKAASTGGTEWTPPSEWPPEMAASDAGAEADADPEGAGSVVASGPTRDIYYIVLDGYAREDVLREVYGFDNAPFLRRLEQAGFHVIEDARANYTKTYLSLASSLNGRYLDDVREGFAGVTGSRGMALPYAMIHENAVMRFLEARGYTTYSFRTGWGPTQQLRAADVNVGCGLSTGWEFHKMLLDYTAAWWLRGRILGRMNDYTTQRCLLDRLLAIHDEPGPKFVFVHLLTPHHPAVFGPDGEPAEWDATLLGDETGWGNKRGYLGEVEFINGVMLGLVDTLRTRVEPQPIIVLQSDHGTASVGWGRPLEVVGERVPILHTLYLPGVDSIPADRLATPVNTFRFIFSAYFGTPAALLPNHSYYSPHDDPNAFVRVDSLRPDPGVTAGSQVDTRAPLH